MSIFPRLTRRGSQVTIHWNFNASRLTQAHIMPYVRIGVQAPDGQLTLLHDGHLLGLPGPPPARPVADVAAQHLPKSVPLLVLASYLSGRQPRAQLVDMLEGMQTGRHYYFPFAVAPDAPLGRYTLLSELYVDGRVQHSGTAVQDFFFVEELHLAPATRTPTGGLLALLTNPGPEPVPVRVVEYLPGSTGTVQEVPAQGTLTVQTATPGVVLYSEEREALPLTDAPGPVFLRNQRLLTWDKAGADETITFVMAGEEDEAYELSGPTQAVWRRADGLSTRAELPGPELQAAYQDLLDAGMILELPR
ncbi:hypothetical protein BEN47_19235 [Hymenobacter lapidarius]|uniref:Uncharacterized protein n=1 Tax=Hymenobacter lapidarius TaxID=1908237 RepID=A0A1G1SSF0_9BACT|nr:hypothetical protein [Hymenobacter lapidarius]OGX81546.1 hypothetical protein BEN47_19235 [Hymenobacter lapidarius]